MIFKMIAFVWYVSKVMLFENGDDVGGPLVSETEFIYDDVLHEQHPVNLFDRIRRAIFNPYHVHDGLWEVDQRRIQVWSCPTCLSFWVSFLVSIPFFFSKKFSIGHLLNTISLHFALSGFSTLLHQVSDYFEVQNGKLLSVWAQEGDIGGEEELE